MVKDKVVKTEDVFGTKTKIKASEAYKELDDLWNKRVVYQDMLFACEQLVLLDDYFEEVRCAGKIWALSNKEVVSIDKRADELCNMLLDAGFDPVINPFEEDINE